MAAPRVGAILSVADRNFSGNSVRSHNQLPLLERRPVLLSIFRIQNRDQLAVAILRCCPVTYGLGLGYLYNNGLLVQQFHLRGINVHDDHCGSAVLRPQSSLKESDLIIPAKDPWTVPIKLPTAPGPISRVAKHYVACISGIHERLKISRYEPYPLSAQNAARSL
jgi:hypothetical protein